jgi:NhaP-type Na+/H+ or K+/H+ antiporter
VLSSLEFEAAGPDELVLSIVTLTVALSVLLHGATAEPIARWLAHRTSQLPAGVPEMLEVPHMRSRHRLRPSGRPEHPGDNLSG